MLHKLAFTRPIWMIEGRCAEVDPELFFADYPGDKHAFVAKTICANCEVRDTCLEFALTVLAVDDFGVWGGTTENERKRIRAQRRGINVIDLTDEQIDQSFDIRDYLDDEPVRPQLLAVDNHEFDVDEAAEEAALEALIERELLAA